MFQVQMGKRYEFVERTRAGTTVFTARVTSVEDRVDFRYVGFVPDDTRVGRWGFTRVYRDGFQKPFGITIKKECR